MYVDPKESARKDAPPVSPRAGGTVKKIETKAANDKFKLHFEPNVTTR